MYIETQRPQNGTPIVMVLLMLLLAAGTGAFVTQQQQRIGAMQAEMDRLQAQSATLSRDLASCEATRAQSPQVGGIQLAASPVEPAIVEFIVEVGATLAAVTAAIVVTFWARSRRTRTGTGRVRQIS